MEKVTRRANHSYLNTSYVDIKQYIGNRQDMLQEYLNTSYVDIKPV